MKNIIFTGATGFLGSAVCEKLLNDGHKILAFDNFSRKTHIHNINKNISVYEGDVRSIEDLNNAIKLHGPFDAMWHFAYVNGTSTFYSKPELVLDVGVKGAINTIDCCLKHNIKEYVLCSTSEVYNEPTQVPTTEKEKILIPDIHNPRFSYSGGKIISELLTIHYAAKLGLNTKIFRPHNVYGPNMGTEHVIPELIKKILFQKNKKFVGDKLIVNIQGSASDTRAFCYVGDAANEMVLASNDNSEKASPIYNIGMQEEINISDLTYLIADILNVEIIVNALDDRPIGGPKRRCPSMEKLSKLGFVKEYSLHDGLVKTVDWYKNYYLSKVVDE
jgi:UDP-glucose 4-epimerase